MLLKYSQVLAVKDGGSSDHLGFVSHEGPLTFFMMRNPGGVAPSLSVKRRVGSGCDEAPREKFFFVVCHKKENYLWVFISLRFMQKIITYNLE